MQHQGFSRNSIATSADYCGDVLSQSCHCRVCTQLRRRIFASMFLIRFLLVSHLYHIRVLFFSVVAHSFLILLRLSVWRENNALRIEKNVIQMSSVQRRIWQEIGTNLKSETNVLNSLNHSRLSEGQRRMLNNVTWARGEWTIMRGDWRITRGECDPRWRYSRSHRTTESNTLQGYIIWAIDSERAYQELSSLYMERRF